MVLAACDATERQPRDRQLRQSHAAAAENGERSTRGAELASQIEKQISIDRSWTYDHH